jgi:hypothetical protein
MSNRTNTTIDRFVLGLVIAGATLLVIVMMIVTLR